MHHAHHSEAQASLGRSSVHLVLLNPEGDAAVGTDPGATQLVGGRTGICTWISTAPKPAAVPEGHCLPVTWWRQDP